MRRMLTVVFVLGALILAVTPQVLAQQQKCVEFRALLRMTLQVNLETNEGAWNPDTDGIWALLDGKGVKPTLEFVQRPTGTYHGAMGMDQGGIVKYIFNGNDSITIGDWHATYEFSPGKAGLYNYDGLGKITGGTGVFQNATGSITEKGPFIFWIDPENPKILLGKYSGAVVASICPAK